MPNLGSSYDQNQVVSTKAVVSGSEVNEENGEKEERLYVSRNNVSVDMYNAFLDYRLVSGSD